MDIRLTEETLPFTGERYVPSLGGEIALEHWHRYVLARSLAIGKDVLDIASGEGYGTAILGSVAASVVGVEIDPATVAHARRSYAGCSNVRFLEGSCVAIPLPDAAVDLVVSFETIEHHDKHTEMLREIKRVLRPGGMLFISSPNRPVYSEQSLTPNPFHVKELDYEELMALLRHYFACVAVRGQKIAQGSFVFSLGPAESDRLTAFAHARGRVIETTHCLNSPVYYLAVCSDGEVAPVARALDSVFLDRDEDLLTAMGHHSATVQAWLDSQPPSFEELAQVIDHMSQESDELRAQMRAIESSRAWRLRNRLVGLYRRLRGG